MKPGLQPNSREEAQRLLMSRAIDTSFQVPTPNNTPGLLAFQRAGVEYANGVRNLLQADPPGVGKTIQTIGFMNVKGISKALIVCPASLLYNWKRELETWHVSGPRIEIFHPKTFNPRNPPDVLLMSYYFAGKVEAVKLILSWGKYTLCVLDECQYLRTPTAARTKLTLAKNGLISRAEHVHALSGTPLVNRPIEVYPIIKTLCPQALGGMNKFEFGIQFCAGWKAPWGKWDFNGASNLKILGMKLRSNFMVRRKKEAVLPQLPEKFPPNIIYLDTDASSRSAVKRLALFDEEALKKSTVSFGFEDLSTARKELGLSKVPAAVRYIKEQLDSGREKILIFAHHKEVIAEYARELLPYGVVTITGGMSPKAKDDAVQNFQKNESPRVAVLSIQAAGVGLTLTAADYVCFPEFSWVPGENEQAIDRTHRIGQTKGIVIDYLVVEDSLEERMLKYLWKKQKTFDGVFE